MPLPPRLVLFGTMMVIESDQVRASFGSRGRNAFWVPLPVQPMPTDMVVNRRASAVSFPLPSLSLKPLDDMPERSDP